MALGWLMQGAAERPGHGQGKSISPAFSLRLELTAWREISPGSLAFLHPTSPPFITTYHITVLCVCTRVYVQYVCPVTSTCSALSSEGAHSGGVYIINTHGVTSISNPQTSSWLTVQIDQLSHIRTIAHATYHLGQLLSSAAQMHS